MGMGWICGEGASRGKRIEERDEIQAGLLVRPIGKTQGQVASGRETDHADPIGIESPLRCVRANDAEGLKAVGDDQGCHPIQEPIHSSRRLEAAKLVQEVGGSGLDQAVLQNKCRDADGVQIARRLGAFRVDVERVEAASGTDNDGGSVGRAGSREVGRERRVDDVSYIPLAEEIGLRLLSGPVFGAWRFPRPKPDLLRSAYAG